MDAETWEALQKTLVSPDKCVGKTVASVASEPWGLVVKFTDGTWMGVSPEDDDNPQLNDFDRWNQPATDLLSSAELISPEILEAEKARQRAYTEKAEREQFEYLKKKFEAKS